MATIHSYRLKGKSKDSYLECVLEFPLTTISSDEHLETAQSVIDGEFLDPIAENNLKCVE
jgi:hypothetical protein